MKVDQFNYDFKNIEVAFLNPSASIDVERLLKEWREEADNRVIVAVPSWYACGTNPTALRVGSCRSGSPTVYVLRSLSCQGFEGTDVLVYPSDSQESNVDFWEAMVLTPDKTNTIQRQRAEVKAGLLQVPVIRMHGYKRKMESYMLDYVDGRLEKCANG